jgi:gamma-glutamyl-gamma-aminobutyraldehyde dehydrogenase
MTITLNETAFIDRTGEVWRARPENLQVDPRPVINGRRQDRPAVRPRPLVSAITGTTITVLADCQQRDVDIAVLTARAEFETGQWRRIPAAERAAVLTAWAQLIEDNRDELAVLICLETGKPAADCLGVDLAGVVRAIRWYAAVIGKYSGDHPDTSSGSLALVGREPAGVVAAVTPWNFPLAQIGYEVVPALALGNSVLVKPSPHAPLAVLRVAELAYLAGLPPGALAVLTGGEPTGAALGLHQGIDVVSVTGSPAAGRAFLGYSAASNGKRVWPELGGKSTALVCADAPDITIAARRLAWGAYFNAGQMCTGVSRILVEHSVVDDFLTLFTDSLDALVIGHPMHWETDIGPVISQAAADTVTATIADAIASGARLVRGEPVTSPPVQGGAFLAPTLLHGGSPTAATLTTEVFGPVTTVLGVDSAEEMLRLTSGFNTGMAASVWSADLNTAMALTQQLRVGTVWVNGFETDDLTVPAGGRGPSGYGRSKGLAVLDKYSDLKTVWVSLSGG